MKRAKKINPGLYLEAFNCPHCGVYAHQKWNPIIFEGKHIGDGFWIVSCEHCRRVSIWAGYNEYQQVFPISEMNVEPPNEDLNDEIKRLYHEAAEIKDKSPRAAAALLRLALQELCKQLGGSGKNINDDIAELVKNGISEDVQKALDSVRIVGNNAVHPGEINLGDNEEIVNILFEIINFIADQMITIKKRYASLYENLPARARQAVEKRDKKA